MQHLFDDECMASLKNFKKIPIIREIMRNNGITRPSLGVRDAKSRVLTKQRLLEEGRCGQQEPTRTERSTSQCNIDLVGDKTTKVEVLAEKQPNPGLI